MVVFHTYVDRAIFLLFLDHQDTESESWEKEMSISQLIFTQVKHKRLYGTTNYILYNMSVKYCGNSHIC